MRRYDGHQVTPSKTKSTGRTAAIALDCRGDQQGSIQGFNTDQALIHRKVSEVERRRCEDAVYIQVFLKKRRGSSVFPRAIARSSDLIGPRIHISSNPDLRNPESLLRKNRGLFKENSPS
ncbi:hypothetical protein BD410DRAFT_79275 [Rickenella mellea]|uniref:Uncharacterized protein n=1 Tax=Rickenella mellea TaxID=50990 RepID=A0A4Y7PKJ0_9AGAM|nr:hypothetical protein BD410DRAFT_79275 [Rickenella mellea]